MEYICKDYKSNSIELKKFTSGSLECLPTTSTNVHGTRETTDHNLYPEALTTVTINNLNEFICENVLAEFLRQNNIYVAKCVPALSYNERSRNFQVSIRESDLGKVLEPELWPKGVILSLKGNDNQINKHVKCQDSNLHAVYGRREKNLPGVVITSGMSYWHS